MESFQEVAERIFRVESGRVLATLIHQCGDFDLAEDALQDAFAVALEVWPQQGLPRSPAAWLTTAARRKVIDRLRRDARYVRKREQIAEANRLDQETIEMEHSPETEIPDDRLRLIFTACHPALSLEARVALTLKTLCGLGTREIARAFLVPEATLSQRLVRAKRKIRLARIPYRVPPREILPQRLASVLKVIYLVFNEGYAALEGPTLVRSELCQEAIHLGELLVELMPAEPEVLGLTALMWLHHSRRQSRVSASGALLTLEEQDRASWDREAIRRGLALLERALVQRNLGPYQIQAAIGAVHARTRRPEETDWKAIVALYDVLLAMEPSPVVELNRAAAIAMADGPDVGLEALDALERRGDLSEYHLLHAARADLLRRLKRFPQASKAYRSALALARNPAERAYLERRLREVESA